MSDFPFAPEMLIIASSVVIFLLVLAKALRLKRELMLLYQDTMELWSYHSLILLWLMSFYLIIYSSVYFNEHGHAHIGNLFYLRLALGLGILVSLKLMPKVEAYKITVTLAVLLGAIEGLSYYPFILALMLMVYRELRLNYSWHKETSTLKGQKQAIEAMLKELEEEHKEKVAISLHDNLHDHIGQRLSAVQRLLLNKDVDYHKLYPLLNDIVNQLPAKPLQSPSEALRGLLKTCRLLGLRAQLEGALPQNTDLAQVLVQLISEAINNAVRHGNATEINININNDLRPTLSISNNGQTSQEPLEAGKGLEGIKKLLATVDYILLVEQGTPFTIIGKPREEND